MAHYCKNCTHPPEIAIKKAIDFFGPQGLGLQIKEAEHNNSPCFACLSSDLGYIYVTASENSTGSEIELETSELDPQASRFLETM